MRNVRQHWHWCNRAVPSCAVLRGAEALAPTASPPLLPFCLPPARRPGESGERAKAERHTEKRRSDEGGEQHAQRGPESTGRRRRAGRTVDLLERRGGGRHGANDVGEAAQALNAQRDLWQGGLRVGVSDDTHWPFMQERQGEKEINFSSRGIPALRQQTTLRGDLRTRPPRIQIGCPTPTPERNPLVPAPADLVTRPEHPPYLKPTAVGHRAEPDELARLQALVQSAKGHERLQAAHAGPLGGIPRSAAGAWHTGVSALRQWAGQEARPLQSPLAASALPRAAPA